MNIVLGIVLDFSVRLFRKRTVYNPLLLHRYQYCVCKSSMLNTTCASINNFAYIYKFILLSKLRTISITPVCGT